MATLELEKTQVASVEEQAQRHNAMISERYRRLQNAEHAQFASEPVRNATITPEKPAVTFSQEQMSAIEQAPQITEFVPTRMQVPVFTTEKFEAVVQEKVEVATPPKAVSAPTEIYATHATQASQYMLSSMAKIVMAICATVLIVMMSLIAVNSSIIRKKQIRIKNLEEQQQELNAKYQDIQRRIEQATSEDTIAEYALSQGMIPGN